MGTPYHKKRNVVCINASDRKYPTGNYKSNANKLKKPKSKFWAIHKVTGEKLEGILYDDGSCMLGLDAFRSLSKTSCESYETYKYSSLSLVKEKYDIKKPVYTAWYMENRQLN